MKKTSRIDLINRIKKSMGNPKQALILVDIYRNLDFTDMLDKTHGFVEDKEFLLSYIEDNIEDAERALLYSELLIKLDMLNLLEEYDPIAETNKKLSMFDVSIFR